ncbi:hypothetical protein FE257_011535 [Aspergillus nanangensis]|uniref:Uncharacterized protein n=1 Tax=Aspergillus nanangensis TaxID=2582783 RepID=A0AAD4GRC8_ASPNN|nr:hypothetical protein FE257_011535 [Aspergillus nanangensis]
MQSLWSRSAPAQSTCRCVSCLSTVASGVTSRAASAAGKKRLRIGNSVTALYTSIFAAAALADAQAKAKRRSEWKEKIAAVKEEVNELVDEEHRLMEALTSRRKKKNFNGLMHVRQYSTSSATAIPDRFQRSATSVRSRSAHTGTAFRDDYENLLDDCDVKVNADIAGGNNVETQSGSQRLQELIAEYEDPLMEDSNEDFGLGLEDDTIPDWLAFDKTRQKCIRKLAVKQLAIRFLLRPAMAHSYLGLRMNYEFDYSVPRVNVQDLLTELNDLRKRIRTLKTDRNAYIDDLAKDLRLRDRQEIQRQNRVLDQEVRHDTDLYLQGRMSLPELLLRLANNLLQANDPDRPHTMRTMLLAFAKTRQTDLGDLIIKAMLPNKFPLNSSMILTILHFYRKTKNLKGFDLFLEMIRGDSYPVDLVNLGFYKQEIINGIEITVPPVHATNPIVWSTLIVSSLRFDQPARADAYLHAARRYGYMDDFTTLYAYLKFYAIRNDWDKGLQTLKRALAFMASSSIHNQERVERLVVLMVHLCDACAKYDISESVITAAVNSGLDWRIAEKQSDLAFPNDPELQRWQNMEDVSTNETRERPLWEKIYTFVNAISEQLDEVALPMQSDESRWQKLMGTYAQGVLSAVRAGIPAEYKASDQTLEQECSRKLLRAIEFQNEKLAREEDEAKARHREINDLKDEVAQLKQMVFELSGRTALNNPVSGEALPTDLGQLKTQLSVAAATATAKTPLDEAPAKNNKKNNNKKTRVRYYRSTPTGVMSMSD